MKSRFLVCLGLLSAAVNACGTIPNSPRHTDARVLAQLSNATSTSAVDRPFAPGDSGQSLAVDIGTLHGLGKEKAIALLEQFARMGAEYIVVLDLVYSDPAEDTELKNELRQILSTYSPELGAARNTVVYHKVDDRGDDLVGTSLFPRDYFPIYRKTAAGSYVPATFKYDESSRFRSTGGVVRDAFLNKAGVGSITLSSDRKFEGGNFQTDGAGNCFVSSGGRMGSNVGPSNPVLEGILKKNLACKSVTILDGLASEDSKLIGTNHLDMWAKFLDSKTVLVAELSPAMRADYEKRKSEYVAKMARHTSSMTEARYENIVSELTRLLNKNVATLASQGYNVVRIPVPMPGFTMQANLNGVQIGRKLLLPRYDASDFNGGTVAPDLYEGAHKETERLIKAVGYEIEWTDYTSFAKLDGALHCMTTNIPTSIVEAYVLR